MTLDTLQVVDHPRPRGRPTVPRERCPLCRGSKKRESRSCRACYHPEKGDTTRALAVLSAARPNLNLTDAAKIVGVTRERVRQIANTNDLPFYRGAYRKARPLCWVCGEELTQGKVGPRRWLPQHRKCSWVTFNCETCHQPVRRRRHEVTRNLKDPLYKRPYRRCSKRCPAIIREAPCTICGEILTLTPGQSSSFTLGKTTRASCKRCWPVLRAQNAAAARAARKKKAA